MTYDFTSIMERAGHDALALDALGHGGMAPDAPDAGFDPIPMWVADMNFPTCPAITRAIIERAQHPAFGYFAPSKAYYQAIIDWQRTRNGVEGLKPSHIGYENGVLGGVVSTLASFAEPGDAVLLHSPTYIGFTKSLENNGFRIVHSPLVPDARGVFRMDYEDMARKLEEHHIHVAVFCSPHNPCGRVWERTELEQAMEVFAAHDCVVVSDEIWSDLILPAPAAHADAPACAPSASGSPEVAPSVSAGDAVAPGSLAPAPNAPVPVVPRHIPTQSVSDDARRRTVALYAPSKTFNLAGLVGSYHIIYDDYLRDRVRSRASKSHYNSMNVLSMHALVGAYSAEGAAWLDELREVLGVNVDFACSYIAERFEGVRVSRPEGTYMLWLDCTAWREAHGCSIEELERAGWRVGVDWQDGRMFGGPCHIRMNLALPLSRVQEAFDRLDRYVFNA